MAVGVRHQFVGLLRRRVQADRVVDAVVFGERQVRVATVHARTRRVDEVLDVVVATAFEDVREADDVALDVRVRVGQRVAHAGLRREVHDLVELLARKQRVHAGAVGDVELHEAKGRVRGQPREPVALYLRVVIVVEIVQADHHVAAGQQNLRDMHADEAGCAGDQDFHVRLRSMNCRIVVAA